jgi:hypothetical protein
VCPVLNKDLKSRDMTLAECLLSMHKALDSISNTAKKTTLKLKKNYISNWRIDFAGKDNKIKRIGSSGTH